MSSQHPKTPSTKPQVQRQNHAAFLRGFMDHKNHHGFDPRCFWPHLIPVPWSPVHGVGWPQQFPGSPGPFIDPTHIFASPFFTRQQQQQQQQSTNMSQENGGTNSSAPAAGGWGSPIGGPPSSPRRAPTESADAPGAIVSGGQKQHQAEVAGAAPHLPADRALQQLARQLDDAIAFCRGCLEQHDGDVERVAPYVDAACRGALWRQLLEARFRASGRDRHLFANLRADVRYWVQRAMEAAAADVEAARADQAGDSEETAWCEEVVHEVVILRTRAEEVGKQAEGAMEDLAACKRMVKEMGIMKAKCEELLDGDKQGGDGQDTESGEGTF